MQFDRDFRDNVLRTARDYFLVNSKDFCVEELSELLQLENNHENHRLVSRALDYWYEKSAIKAARQERTDYNRYRVSSLTSAGIDIVEGVAGQGSSVHNITNILGGNVGVIGAMYGGTIHQDSPREMIELIQATENLRSELANFTDSANVAIDALAEQIIQIGRSPNPDLKRLGGIISGLSQLIQTLGATPAAWPLVVAAAGKISLGH